LNKLLKTCGLIKKPANFHTNTQYQKVFPALMDTVYFISYRSNWVYCINSKHRFFYACPFIWTL